MKIPIFEQVISYEFHGHSIGIFKYGVDWLVLNTNNLTGECKGNMCLCFDQASEIMDGCVEKYRDWVN